jgi:hypothetical protein
MVGLSADPSANILSVLSFLFVHKIFAAITSLNGTTLLLATYLDISLFQRVIDFYHNQPTQPGTKGVQ